MTFLELQDRVMARTNLTTTAARTRVKEYLNERLRRVSTSCGVGRVRFGTVSINTVATTATITSTGLVKVKTVSIPAQDRVLGERTYDQIISYDPDLSRTGVPEVYAVQKVNAATLTLKLWPIPDAIYAVTIAGVLAGTDLSANGDIPGLPEDFHDILVFGALADEYPHLEKLEQSMMFEQKFNQRLSELRYYIAKSAYLSRPELQADDFWWRYNVGI